jgi:glycerol-3-phosphate O-acyltransferase
MSQTVAVPLWLALLVLALAAWALLDRLLVPGVRFVIRQRANRLLDRLETQFQVRVEPFKLTKREVLVDRLRFDPQVLEAAAAAARDGGVPHEIVAARVAAYAKEIVPAFNAYAYFRLGYALARGVVRSLYRVRVGAADREALGRIPRKATVVFVMNHRSNVDYLLVAYLVAEKAALSFAVGEWARVWPLQALVRSMGAFFVRRNSRDALYRKVLERYVAMAVEGGVTQAVFPEGGLSRDGALRPPKLGLIDYMLRAFDPEGPRDLVFVPVGLNLDRTLEDRTLLLDLEPEIQKPGRAVTIRTAAAFAGRNLALLAANRWHRFGYACADFGSPVSLKEWLAHRGVALNVLDRDGRLAQARALADDLMAAVGRAIPVLPVPLVAAVLVREPERRFTRLELKADALSLLGRLEAAGAPVYVPRRDREYAIDFGVRALALRHLLVEEDGLLAASREDLPLLRYYANSIAHHVGEA